MNEVTTMSETCSCRSTHRRATHVEGGNVALSGEGAHCLCPQCACPLAGTCVTGPLVATIFGVGTEYEIVYSSEMGGDEYDVRVSSGPVTRSVARRLTWLAAMNTVRDAVATEIEDNR